MACYWCAFKIFTEPYLGKNETRLYARTVGEQAAFRLMVTYYNTGRNLSMENFFTSLKLVTSLNLVTLLSVTMERLRPIMEKRTITYCSWKLYTRQWKSLLIKKKTLKLWIFTIWPNMELMVWTIWPENTPSRRWPVHVLFIFLI